MQNWFNSFIATTTLGLICASGAFAAGGLGTHGVSGPPKIDHVPIDVRRTARKLLMQGRNLLPEEKLGKRRLGGAFHPEENLLTVTLRDADAAQPSSSRVGRVDFYVLVSTLLAKMLGLREHGIVKNAAIPMHDIFASLEPYFVGTLTDRSMQYFKLDYVDPQKIFAIQSEKDAKHIQIAFPSPYDPKSSALSMTFPLHDHKVDLVRTETTESDFWKKLVAQLDVRKFGDPVVAEIHMPNKPVAKTRYSPIFDLDNWKKSQQQTDTLKTFLIEVIEKVTGMRPAGVM
jgi:hypothetical protein